jgi:DNA polymerase-3 subunit delta'
MLPWLVPLFNKLSLRIAAGKLHHGLLIQGPVGIGKVIFTQQLAHLLLCQSPQAEQLCGRCQACKLLQAGSHPDLHVIESEKQIGVDQVREAIKKLLGSAHLSGAKVLIIYQAHTMTESSANSLLKTLEEPTGNTFLLLTTDKPDRLLPTIRSRCENMRLPLADVQTSLNWVKQQYQGDIDNELLRIFGPRPLALLDELQNQQDISYQTFCQGLQALLDKQISALQLATQWQENAEKTIKWLQYWLQTQPNIMTEERLFEVAKQGIKAVRLVANPGVNKILLLTELLHSIHGDDSF